MCYPEEMKLLPTLLCSLIALSQIAPAGGNTSIIDIASVSEIKVEEGRITIKGNGIVKRRVVSNAEKGDTTVFGQPAQWLHAKVKHTVFEVVPYFTADLKGVPTGVHDDKELKHLSDEWWKFTHATAKKIQKGDAITIGYQGDRTTINSFRITKIESYGFVSLKTK